MHIVFTFMMFPGLTDSTVAFNVLTKYIMAKVKLPNSLKVLSIRNEFASELTSTPKADLFCSFKRRKLISRNKVKFVNFKVKISSFSVKRSVVL